jgi:xylulokinase
MMKTVLGIDVGTQSSKVMFYDFENRKVVALASAAHDIVSREDGTSEQEPAWWAEAVRSALGQVDPAIRATAVALAVSGQQHGLVSLDAEGRPTAPAKLWNDTSTVKQCDELTAAFGGRSLLISELGNPILPGYTAGKILWLKQNNPEAFDRTRHVLLPHDYLNYLLTGAYTMEYGDASGTGLFDVRSRLWNREICDAIDGRLLDMLPTPTAPDAGAGWVIAEASRQFGIPEGIPVATGGGDNMMAAVGTGAVEDGSLTMSLGTSGTLFGYSSVPVVDPQGIIAAFCSSTGGWLPLLCTMNCTVATEQFRDLLLISLDDIDALAESVPAGSDGLMVMPYFTGERIPNLPRARASIQGMTLGNTSKAHIMRASMEAAIYGLKVGLDSLQALGMNADGITITGGGSRSRVWRQIAADICGLPIRLPVHADSAALGAALQALWYKNRVIDGKPDEITEIVRSHLSAGDGEVILPSKDAQSYRRGYEEYRQYLEILSPKYT